MVTSLSMAVDNIITNRTHMVDKEVIHIDTARQFDAVQLEAFLGECDAADGVTEDAEKLATYKADLHKSCDFLMKNFDTRQSAITAEIEGLGQAKSILSGADFGF